MSDDLKPCPFCNAEMQFEESGYEHPYSDTCPLDSLYIEDGHVAAWNRRATPTVQEAAQVLLACHTVQTMIAAGKPLDLAVTLRAIAGDSHD